MIATVILLAALAALGAWVLVPLFGSRTAKGLPEEHTRLEEIKHATYRSILDLEFDRQLGKVSESDYHMLRSEHEAEAAKALHSMDRLRQRTAAPDDEFIDQIEAEIAAARRRLRR